MGESHVTEGGRMGVVAEARVKVEGAVGTEEQGDVGGGLVEG